jgi:hypothetical protein
MNTGRNRHVNAAALLHELPFKGQGAMRLKAHLRAGMAG